jgi:pimeloyl-ACP methyl ester carboxylesterase
MAKIARLTSEPSITVRRKFNSLCFSEFGSLDRKQFAGFAVMEADDRAVIAFRGTLMSSLHNWKTDLEMTFVGTPRRHHGFNRAWESMKVDVCAWLAQRKPKQITLTGHSLGGAIATVAALDLAKDWSIDEVVVFGCPRVGSDEFVTAYSAAPDASDDPTIKLGAITTRYVKTTDLVPHVPVEFMGYRHVGTCVYFNRHGERVKTPRPLLERVYTLSDLEEEEQPRYGVLGRLGIDLNFTPKTTPSPVRLYGVLDLLTRVLPGWVAMAFIVAVVLLVDGFRHPMTGYIALLQRQLERDDKQTS